MLGYGVTLALGLVIALIIAISVTSYTGLNSATSGFNEYRSLARNSNLSSRIQANMLLVRLNVKDFILTKDDAAVEKYHERLAKLKSFLDTAKQQIADVDRLQKVKSIDHQVTRYNSAFEDVVDYMKQRDIVVLDRLDPSGLAMRQAITEIMKSAHKAGDADAAYFAGRLQEALLLGRLYATKFLNTNSAADSERALTELNESVASRAVELDKALQNPARRAMLSRFDKAFELYRDAFNDTSTIIFERNVVIKETLDVIGPLVATDAEHVKLSIQQRQDVIGPIVKASDESTIERVVGLSTISVVIGILSALFLLAVVRKTLLAIGGEPVEMETMATRIADGDLTIGFDENTKSRGVYAAMQHMVDKLGGIVSSVNGTAAELNKGASEISRGNAELHDRTETQAESLQNAASAMEQITSIVKNNAENVRKVSELATDASKHAEAGGVVVGNAVVAMTAISSSSHKIASIITVIDEIAFQTNLLALNAAVEAARAGEQGRGFAVVASEVRVLAQRSSQAASEISELIKDSVAKVNDGTELVDESGKTLNMIVDSVKNVTTLIADIAVASNEQSIGIQEIDRVIRDVDDITRKNSQLVDNVADNSRTVEEQALHLTELMTHFKLLDEQVAKQA